MKFEKELKVAIEAVEKACSLCKNVQSTLVSEETMTKKDKSPVTVADFGAQAVILSALAKAFPEDPAVAEEDTAELRAEGGKTLLEFIHQHVGAIIPGVSTDEIIEAIDRGGYEGGAEGRHWTLDPIDGTKGFLRGEQYAVALALIEDGEVVLGIVGCPDLPHEISKPGGKTGCILWSVKGEGSYFKALGDESSRNINVSDILDSSGASFCESVESAHSSHGDAQRIAEILGVTNPPIRIDSQCKYAVIARGDASIYLRLPTRKDYVEKIWDHASGALIVEEAGGTVTDIYGLKLDFSLGRTLLSNKGIVATNGNFHDQVISAIAEVLGDGD